VQLETTVKVAGGPVTLHCKMTSAASFYILLLRKSTQRKVYRPKLLQKLHYLNLIRVIPNTRKGKVVDQESIWYPALHSDPFSRLEHSASLLAGQTEQDLVWNCTSITTSLCE